MIRFELSLEIRRPRSEVFAFWSDPQNLAAWQSGVVEVKADAGPVGRGTRYTVVRKALGMTQEMRTTLVEFEAEQRVVETARGGPAKHTVTTVFSELPAGRTRLDTIVEVDLGGLLGRIGDKLAAGKIKAQAEGDQARLKALLEAR